MRLRTEAAALAAAALVFLVPGLVTHEPWKTHDVVAIEIVAHMHASGDWLVPRLAAEPWLERPPLYHWSALAFASALQPLLPLHGAARLASAAWFLLALAFAWAAARHAAGARDPRRAGPAAALLLLGSLGLLVHAHEALPELAALAASFAGHSFLARAARHPYAAGAAFGLAAGAAFLASGPAVPVALAVAAVASLALGRAEARAGAPAFTACALFSAGALVAAWVVPLALREPELARTWVASLAPQGEFAANLAYFAAAAGWFAWPAWPIAAWTLWAQRRELREPALIGPAAGAAAALVAIASLGPARDVQLVALLAPLVLLAAQGASRLPRGAARALDWFAVLACGFFAALVWLGYVAMTTGWPPRIARNFAKTAPGFAAEFDTVAFLAAAALTLGWCAALALVRAPALRPLVRWAAGMTLLWGLFALLWLPWADYQKSYRAVALQLRAQLPASLPCVAWIGLGASQRAALRYHAAIELRRYDPARPLGCAALVVQGRPAPEPAPPPGPWRKVADLGRPGDKAERYRLYLAP